jgi:hypothetical protein
MFYYKMLRNEKSVNILKFFTSANFFWYSNIYE